MAPERDPTEAEIGAQALRGLLDVDSLRSAAWLAGFAGGALLILTALVAWLGTAETRLDSYWLGWATAPALLAAFGGPVLGRRLLSRHSVARWRMFVTAVMALSSAAWAFALAVSMTFDPLEGRLLAIVCLALAISLLPNLSSVSCLITQLLVQLAFALGLVFVSGQPLQELILAAGVWGALVSACSGSFTSRSSHRDRAGHSTSGCPRSCRAPRPPAARSSRARCAAPPPGGPRPGS